jgi:hypothetical protein
VIVNAPIEHDKSFITPGEISHGEHLHSILRIILNPSKEVESLLFWTIFQTLEKGRPIAQWYLDVISWGWPAIKHLYLILYLRNTHPSTSRKKILLNCWDCTVGTWMKVKTQTIATGEKWIILKIKLKFREKY